MEYVVEEVRMGDLRIELSVREQEGCTVFCTARDLNNRKVWRTAVMHDGEIKIYGNRHEAISDVKRKIGAD